MRQRHPEVLDRIRSERRSEVATTGCAMRRHRAGSGWYERRGPASAASTRAAAAADGRCARRGEKGPAARSSGPIDLCTLNHPARSPGGLFGRSSIHQPSEIWPAQHRDDPVQRDRHPAVAFRHFQEAFLRSSPSVRDGRFGRHVAASCRGCLAPRHRRRARAAASRQHRAHKPRPTSAR